MPGALRCDHTGARGARLDKQLAACGEVEELIRSVAGVRVHAAERVDHCAAPDRVQALLVASSARRRRAVGVQQRPRGVGRLRGASHCC